MISKRAKALQSNPSAIMVGHSICAENPYSLSNPKGYINFGTAENHLMSDLLLPVLNKNIELSKEHIQYNTLYGMDDVRLTITKFFKEHLNLKNLNPDNLVIQTGVSAICESLSFAMFDQDDVIMIPSPYYTGFDHDFTKRFGCRFLKVQLSPEENFVHNIEHFIRSYDDFQNKEKVKAILITHPHNPTGEVLSEDFMDEIIAFCKDKNLELISDEIYALSSYNTDVHISLFQKAVEANLNAHFLYGMAKDFCLAGLKVGFFYSNDQALLEGMKNLSYFHPVSTQTQLLIKSIFDNNDFLDEYIPLNKKRLIEIPIIIQNQLPMYKFIPTEAGLFMLLDLSKYCKNFEEEHILFEKFLNYIRINMTPGKELGLDKPGFFRVCFARPKEDVLEFIVRMRKFHENELS